MKAKRVSGAAMLAGLRRAALRHPGVEESVACKGTAVESSSFKVGGKAFLFLRSGTAMLKLEKSKSEAIELARRSPHLCKTGSGGWTTVALTEPSELEPGLLESWIAESYALFSRAAVPKKHPRTK